MSEMVGKPSADPQREESPFADPGTTAPSIAIGILSYNRSAEVLETLEILEQTAYPREAMRIVVVDNASADGTQRLVRERYGDRVEVLELPENQGAVARNRVLLERPETYLFTFDEDSTPFDCSTIGRCVDYLEAHPEIDGICFRSILASTGRDEFLIWESIARSVHPDGTLEGVFISGTGMCFRGDSIRATNGYDERWHFGGEEGSLSLETLRHGLRIVMRADLKLVHRKAPRAFPTARVIQREMRNSIWMFLRYFPRLLIAPAIVTLVTRVIMMRLLRRRWQLAAAALRGAVEALARAPEFYRSRTPVGYAALWENLSWCRSIFYSPRAHRRAVREQNRLRNVK